MAQQAPNDPNASGQGSTSSHYSEVRSPQFVGGSTDAVTGNIDPSSRQQAAVAPPQTPTTQLANVDVPKSPSIAAQAGGAALSLAAPYVGAKIGGAIGGGAGFGEAVSSTASGIGSDIASLGSKLGFGGGSAAGATGATAAGTTAGQTLGNASGATFGGTTAGETLGDAAAGASGATNAAVGSGLGSTLGGAAGFGIGSGIATAAVGALSGQQIKQYAAPAAESAAGGALGFAIGNFIIPGIGGFVGGAIGSLFCHVAGTPIMMADGSWMNVESIRIGDRVAIGGLVLGRGEVIAAELYDYKDTVLSGEHAVFEDGRWLRVKDSRLARFVPLAGSVLVYPLVVTDHILICERYICADFAETASAERSHSERLAELNSAMERNATLRHLESILGLDGDRVAA